MVVNNEIIDRAHNIMYYLSDNDKRIVLKCIGNYRIIINTDYQEKISSLYKKYNIYNASDKIIIEIKRIYKYLSKKQNNCSNIDTIETDLALIIDNANLLNKKRTSYSKSQKEKQILNDIIEFELKLGMNITLYNEFMEYFEAKILEYEESYQKKRD